MEDGTERTPGELTAQGQTLGRQTHKRGVRAQSLLRQHLPPQTGKVVFTRESSPERESAGGGGVEEAKGGKSLPEPQMFQGICHIW